MAHCVATAVESALAQEGEAVEVVVVDDGSDDDPAAALARFGDRVRLARQENRGVSAARNHAARLASGQWLAFLDADDRWLPGKTRQMLEAVAARPGARFAYAQARGEGSGGRCAILGLPPPADESGRGMLVSLLRTGNQIPMLTGMVLRDAFVEVGGLDESLRTGEDYDLWLRLAERFEGVFVAEALAVYRMHDGGDVMGDVERWADAIDGIHERVRARHAGDPGVAQALSIARARVRLGRGWGRLQRGDRAGARSDLEEAARCAPYRDAALRWLRLARVPAPLYRVWRTLRSGRGP
jgi:GT2 family glycosyltransferase